MDETSNAIRGAQAGCGPADVFDGLQQGQVQYITLCMTATDGMCHRRQIGQQANRACVVAAAERHQRAARR